MIPHYVLLVHGIGDEKKGFNRGLSKNIRKEFAAVVTRLSQPAQEGVSIEEAVWSEITQKDQDHLWRLLFPRLPEKRVGWGILFRHPGAWIPRLRYLSYLRQFVMNYLGDPIAYAPGKPKYQQIHDAVLRQCTEIACAAAAKGATSDNPALLTVVAHSLGSVIFSDLFYELTRPDRERAWPPQIRLANFVSMGSPLALYSLRYGFEPTMFSEPITMQDRDHGLWINVYDPQDILGYPLKPLNPQYDRAVFLDKEINAGQWWRFWQWPAQISPFSHLLYWGDDTVAEIIGRKAALDWLRTTHPEMERVLKLEYETYKTWVRDA